MRSMILSCKHNCNFYWTEKGRGEKGGNIRKRKKGTCKGDRIQNMIKTTNKLGASGANQLWGKIIPPTNNMVQQKASYMHPSLRHKK